jgi:SAM-dependent methyltransferase
LDRREGIDRIGQRARQAVPYMTPETPTEVERLDVQHYALRELIGRNYLAPVRLPRRILDVGSGTGQWAFDMCAEFPSAVVVGFDLLTSKAGSPSNYRLVRGNLLHGLPFADGSFEFVHQRFFFAALPLHAWVPAVRELMRVTVPQGVVELAEPSATCWEQAGPNTQRLLNVVGDLLMTKGIDGGEVVFRSLDRYLLEVGAINVQREEIRMPVGEWGGRAGGLNASNLRNLYRILAPLVEENVGLSVGEYFALVDSALRECEEFRTRVPFAFVYGSKPRLAPWTRMR